VFIVVTGRGGIRTLFGPAPQTMAPSDGSRAFSLRESSGPDTDAVDKALAREIRFDADLWIVELEDIRRPLTDYLTIL
jgi:GMP synthase (glutamine-hydrolysing)